MTKYNFPKVDLHLHLDGSMLPETAWELAHEQKVELPADNLEEFRKFIIVTKDCRSVNEYLKRFDLPLKVLQDKDSIARVTKELILLLDSQGLAYAEIRFAPQLHCQKGLTQRDAIEAVLEGRRQGLSEAKNIKIGILCCMMCQGPEKVNEAANMETAHIVKDYLGKGVVGIDLAGAEGFDPLISFKPMFDIAYEDGVPITCHAGDSQGPDTVRDAMDMHATRIGHGHHIFEDKELCKRAIRDNITLEICPTSNIQCQSREDYDKHPAKQLYDMGVKITINTDNMVLSDIDLDYEYDCCLNKMGFEYNDLIQMNINSVKASFMPESDKAELIEKLNVFLK